MHGASFSSGQSPCGRFVQHGAVRLPDPPGGATDLQGALDALAERFAEGDD